MEVKFYGVRGGYPASGPAFAKVGSHTTCVLVRDGSQQIIIDGGTGLATLGKQIMDDHPEHLPIQIVMIFTHSHHDHIAGLPHFLPVYSSRAKIFAYGPPSMEIDQTIARMFEPPWFPVRFDELQSQWKVHSLRETEIIVVGQIRGAEPVICQSKDIVKEERVCSPDDAMVIKVIRGYGHPREGVYIYRIEYCGKSIVMATDTEGFESGDQRLIEFAQGADLLIHDAQYTPESYLSMPYQGFGHSTYEMACSIAKAANVSQLILTHHCPDSDDKTVAQIEKKAKRLFPKTRAAREGMSIKL